MNSGATRPSARSPSIAYVLDPRFPGGTSAAIADELRATARDNRPALHAISSRMFGGRSVAPVLAEVIEAEGLPLTWDSPVIRADTVILHNPGFLKFQDDLGCRIFARHLIVVTHENFLRPGGAEAFDVSRCLRQIDRASVALAKSLAPVSAHNRRTIEEWRRRHAMRTGWTLLPQNWFNVCDFERAPPTIYPRDRRGRHSRPGFEKFPGRAVMEMCFPPGAEANVILGADLLLADPNPPPVHWTLYPFRGMEVDRFLGMIDFMVYFTAPTWQESFGRVLAEAIAAGKVVISDAATAEPFGGGVVAARPEDVDRIIAGLIAEPARYRDQVLGAQAALNSYAPLEFRNRFQEVIAGSLGAAA